jgi:heparan-alpha-glucosaminide N-acetyltransferase
VFDAATDVLGRGGWAFPLVVVGTNSIAAYCMSHLFEGFIAENLKVHEPLLHGAAVLTVLWLILFWMYWRKLFLRI